MKIFITKYKAATQGGMNYFKIFNGAVSAVYVDHITLDETNTFEDSFSNYDDEILQEDLVLSFTTSNYSFETSVLKTVYSALGKTLPQFFDLTLDPVRDIGFIISFGEDAAHIERGDFIDPSSISTNYRKDDSGYILSFNVFGPEEELISYLETLQAQALSTSFKTFFRFYLSRLFNTQQLTNFILRNDTYFFLQYRIGGDITVSHYIYNKVLAGLSEGNKWRVFLNVIKDLGICYKLQHQTSFTPGTLPKFEFNVFFITEKSSSILPAPTIHDKEDYLVGISYEYSKPYLAGFYVSYTLNTHPEEDYFGSLFIAPGVTTVGFTDLHENGYYGLDPLNFYKTYEWDDGKFSIRNGVVMADKDINFPCSERVFVRAYNAINIGACIGRAFVKDFTYTAPVPPYIPEIYTDIGFKQVIQQTAGREYQFLVSGVKKTLDVSIDYSLNDPIQLFTKFSLDGTTWLVIKIYDRDNFNGSARIKCISI